MSFKIDDFGWVDAHNHVRNDGTNKSHKEWMDNLLNASDALGIEKLCVSVPLTSPAHPSVENCMDANNVVIDAMKYSDRFLGFCYVNSGLTDDAVKEIRRCVTEENMVGIKLYYQYFMDDPVQRHVCEVAAELGVPILMHAGKVMDDATVKRQPRLSGATHMIEAARRFPETTFIQGHIGGGGDWEWNLRALEDSPENLVIDTSGSNIDAAIARKTVDVMGAKRVLFATDMSFEEGVGKIIDAGLSKAERQLVCRENILNILGRKK